MNSAPSRPTRFCRNRPGPLVSWRTGAQTRDEHRRQEEQGQRCEQSLDDLLHEPARATSGCCADLHDVESGALHDRDAGGCDVEQAGPDVERDTRTIGVPLEPPHRGMRDPGAGQHEHGVASCPVGDLCGVGQSHVNRNLTHRTAGFGGDASSGDDIAARGGQLGHRDPDVVGMPGEHDPGRFLGGQGQQATREHGEDERRHHRDQRRGRGGLTDDRVGQPAGDAEPCSGAQDSPDPTGDGLARGAVREPAVAGREQRPGRA
ncbi:hypothetical protein [Nocardioides sp. B-3]|uniref:hypothetical protein n=1 Tax=Nocardioides sp. B-3 TaxID=2895565 RepID=UPI0021523502|nr:hypothetical protein [Nocardioides sp. B-3]UUZ61933.1 hypothetical protein LP418_05775 [Nocardioides sp. B-3]